jgi:hypothetical protein
VYKNKNVQVLLRADVFSRPYYYWVAVWRTTDAAWVIGLLGLHGVLHRGVTAMGMQ